MQYVCSQGYSYNCGKESMDDIINNNTDNTDNDEYEKICYLCHRTESRTGKMITLPQNISICPDCMQKTFDTFQNGGMAGFDLNHFDMEQMTNYAKKRDIPETQKVKKSRKEFF